MFINKVNDMLEISCYYPTIHLFGKYFLVRKHAKKVKKISLWYIYKLVANETTPVSEFGNGFVVFKRK